MPNAFSEQLPKRKKHEVIPDFFTIDPEGAGASGRNYWLGWAEMYQSNDEAFGE